MKSFALLAMLLLVTASDFDSCAAVRGMHWSPASSTVDGKGGTSHHRHGGGKSGSGEKVQPKPRSNPDPTHGPRPSSPVTALASVPSLGPSPSAILSRGPSLNPSPSPGPTPTPKPGPSLEPSPIPRPNPSPGPIPATPSPTPSPSSCPSPPSSPETQPTPTPTTPPPPSPTATPIPDPVPTPGTPSPLPVPSPPAPEQKPTANPPSQKSVFNVLDFGAKGNGVSDDTKAFQTAWAAACKQGESTVLVPADYEFLVGPVSFSGTYCQPNIVFQLDGTIVAPTSAGFWGSGLLQWLEFTKLKGITIKGGGVIEGRGAVWWNEFSPQLGASSRSTSAPEKFVANLRRNSSPHNGSGCNQTSEPVGPPQMSGMAAGKMPHVKPTALRLYGSVGVTVSGITIQNSPQCHLKFDNCAAVEVDNVTIASPGDSPNTDGIHLQNSMNVSIRHSNLSCGDDCVSIQTGCSDVSIRSVTCGPGHGISIGGLGRDNTKACVSNVTVQDIALQGTMTGVRIKTWQGGSGSVRNVRFSNIRVEEVQTPIVIDQYYCDRASCKNQSSAVSLAGVAYDGVKGTYTVQPVRLACSDAAPCSGISLARVELQPLRQRYHMYDPLCWQAYGELQTPTVPSMMECLLKGKPPSTGPPKTGPEYAC